MDGGGHFRVWLDQLQVLMYSKRYAITTILLVDVCEVICACCTLLQMTFCHSSLVFSESQLVDQGNSLVIEP